MLVEEKYIRRSPVIRKKRSSKKEFGEGESKSSGKRESFGKEAATGNQKVI